MAGLNRVPFVDDRNCERCLLARIIVEGGPDRGVASPPRSVYPTPASSRTRHDAESRASDAHQPVGVRSLEGKHVAPRTQPRPSQSVPCMLGFVRRSFHCSTLRSECTPLRCVPYRLGLLLWALRSRLARHRDDRVTAAVLSVERRSLSKPQSFRPLE